jgi:sensor histidine kinase YesM
MNTHFVYNCLNAITGLIVQDKSVEALKAISDFSSLNRFYLESYSKQRVTLETEFTFLSRYVSLQNLRFGNAVAFVVQVSSGLDARTVVLPSMLIQPLIENSLIHGFHRSDTLPHEPQIELLVDKVGKHLIITCKDNGCGFDVSRRSTGSLGLQLIKAQLALVDPGATLDISSAPGKGTTATLTFTYVSLNGYNLL